MIVTAVVCPPAPLLVPGLADRLATLAGDLCASCAKAVGALVGVDTVLILSAPLEPADHRVLRPGDLVTAGGLARSDRPVVDPILLPGGRSTTQRSRCGDDGQAWCGTGAAPARNEVAAGPPVSARSHPVAVGAAVGAHLLAAAEVTAATYAVPVGPDVDIPMPSGRTGLLVMADGAACHGEDAPGGPDARSESFDADLVTALRSGDPATLADTCNRLSALATELRADSLPALSALASLTVAYGPASAALLHYSAPFGVGYPVAVWQWD